MEKQYVIEFQFVGSDETFDFLCIREDEHWRIINGYKNAAYNGCTIELNSTSIVSVREYIKTPTITIGKDLFEI